MEFKKKKKENLHQSSSSVEADAAGISRGLGSGTMVKVVQVLGTKNICEDVSSKRAQPLPRVFKLECTDRYARGRRKLLWA